MNAPRESDDASLREAATRKGSFVGTLKAVAWSFFGVRKSADNAKDMSQLNPVHVIIAGVFVAAVFVLALVAFVRWVVGGGITA